MEGYRVADWFKPLSLCDAILEEFAGVSSVCHDLVAMDQIARSGLAEFPDCYLFLCGALLAVRSASAVLFAHSYAGTLWSGIA